MPQGNELSTIFYSLYTRLEDQENLNLGPLSAFKYVDDESFCGDARAMADALERRQAWLQERGIVLQRAKTKLLMPYATKAAATELAATMDVDLVDIWGEDAVESKRVGVGVL